jgi:hypothetical protein
LPGKGGFDTLLGSRIAADDCGAVLLRLSSIRQAAWIIDFFTENGVGTKKTGKGRRKVGRKKRRMRAKIRHRKG